MMSQKDFINQLVEAFSTSELKDLCFDLGINYDNLPGDRLSSKIEAVLVELHKQKRFALLVAYLERERSGFTWPIVSEVEGFAWAELAEKIDRNIVYIHTNKVPLDLDLRRQLVNMVRRNWIDGYLKHSVYRKIDLNFKAEADQTPSGSRPWELVYQVQEKTDEAVHSTSNLIDYFDTSGRSLLILGEPGSGKTITLLQLCEELLEVASAEIKAKIPMVFNLSSWGKHAKPIDEWLADEGVKYTLSKKFVSDDLIKEERIILLLDGLDEVEADKRNQCIEAINHFRATYMIPLVVCSRTHEFEQLHAKLNVGGALRIEPLQPAQIDQFLTAEGDRLAWLREQMRTDEELQALGKTPLLLSLMPIAYGTQPEADFKNAAGIEGKRDNLFHHFVNKVFAQRPLAEDAHFSQPEALNWVGYIAYNLLSTQQNHFFFESLDEEDLAQLAANTSVHGRMQLTSGILYGVAISTLFWLIASPLLLFVLGSFNSAFSFILSLLLCLAVAIGGGLVSGAIIGTVLGVISLFTQYRSEQDLIQNFQFGIPNSESLKVGARRSLLFIAVFIPFNITISAIFNQSLDNLRESFFLSLVNYIPLSILIAFLLSFVKPVPISDQDRVQPNQGVYSTVRSNLYFVLLLTLVLGIFYAFTAQFSVLDSSTGANIVRNTVFALLFGPLFGTIFGGGLAVIQHIGVRRYLSSQSFLPYAWPWQDQKLAYFLDQMVDRFLLHRVGGGWMFIHRYLLEYFADQWKQQNSA